MRHLYIEKPYSEDDKVLNLSALLLKILRYSGLKEGMYVTAYEPYDIYFCKCYDLITIKEGKFVLRKSTMKTGGSYEYEYIPIEVIPDKVCYHFIRNYFSGCLHVFDNIEEANRDIIESQRGYIKGKLPRVI